SGHRGAEHDAGSHAGDGPLPSERGEQSADAGSDGPADGCGEGVVRQRRVDGVRRTVYADAAVFDCGRNERAGFGDGGADEWGGKWSGGGRGVLKGRPRGFETLDSSFVRFRTNHETARREPDVQSPLELTTH